MAVNASKNSYIHQILHRLKLQAGVLLLFLLTYHWNFTHILYLQNSGEILAHVIVFPPFELIE